MGQATCDDCPLGKYCDPYELANVTGIIDPVECPMGYYCPTRTEFATQNPCSPGSYGNVTQLTAQGQFVNLYQNFVEIKILLQFYTCTV